MIKWINKYKNRITALSGFLIAVGFILNTLGYAAAADYALDPRNAHRGGADHAQSLPGAADESFQHRVAGDDRGHRRAVHPRIYGVFRCDFSVSFR